MASGHNLRPSFESTRCSLSPSPLPGNGCDMRTIQSISWGLANLQTTMTHIRVAGKNLLGLRGPLNGH